MVPAIIFMSEPHCNVPMSYDAGMTKVSQCTPVHFLQNLSPLYVSTVRQQQEHKHELFRIS